MENPFRAGLTPGLKVIETFGWDGSVFTRLDRHLARMEATCGRLGFAFSAKNALAALSNPPPLPHRIRLTCDRDGRIETVLSELAPTASIWRAKVAGLRLSPGDPWLTVKTTRRQVYDEARANLAADVQEMVFLNTRGEVCEGTITNIFADLGDGLLTPPVACGLLPGVLRGEMLDRGLCREAVLRPGDLLAARTLFAGNSLRGLIRLELVRDGINDS